MALDSFDSVPQGQDLALPHPTQIEDALARLADIHAQVARGAHVHGHRAAPVSAMGVVALRSGQISDTDTVKDAHRRPACA